MVASVAAQLVPDRTRFVTLSLRHSQTPLTDQLDRLYRSFTALRKRPIWADAVDGSAAFCEVKIGQDNLWHVHLHVIVIGRYIDQRELSRTWHAVTGDSSIVDVRKVRNAQEVSHYVCKYVTKPLDSTVFADSGRLDEAITALKGRRLCNGAGCLRTINADPPDDDDGIDDWVSVGRLDALCEDAGRGDAAALTILQLLSRRHETQLTGKPPP
jgi:hypothetical protein